MTDSTELNIIVKKSSVLKRCGYKSIKKLRDIISINEEIELWKRYKSLMSSGSKNTEAINRIYNYLFCIYFRNINYLANKAYKNVPRYSIISWSDVIMSCMHGHLEAFSKYDPYRDISYFSFARDRIYYSVVDFIRNVQDVPQYISPLRRKLIPRLQIMSHELKRQVNDDDIYDMILRGEIDASYLSPDVFKLIKIQTFNETNSSISGVNDSFAASILSNKTITINEHNKKNKDIDYVKLLDIIEDTDIRFTILTTFFWNMPLTDTAKILEVSHATAHGLKTRGIKILKSHFGSYYAMMEYIDEQCRHE